jgi:hypothetical protein
VQNLRMHYFNPMGQSHVEEMRISIKNLNPKGNFDIMCTAFIIKEIKIRRMNEIKFSTEANF